MSKGGLQAQSVARVSKVFVPSVSVTVENGMLVFLNFQEVDKILLQMNDSPQESINNWENNVGFKSLRHNFWDVMIAEDAINEAAEAAGVEKIQVYSTDLLSALENQSIRWRNDPSDNSIYWDYGNSFFELTPVLNLGNLIKVGGKIYQFTNDKLIKIINDGDFLKVDKLPSLVEEMSDDMFEVIGTSPRGNCLDNDWSKFNDWKTPENRRRTKVEVEGRAVANFGGAYANDPCYGMRYGTTCKFFVRTYAQRKNFWGSWVYSSSYGPPLHIDDATWNFNYQLYNTGCSGSSTTFQNGIIGQYPTPIYDHFWSWTNQGAFPLNPNTSGWWLFSNPSTGQDKYIVCTINVYQYNIPVYYGTLGPNTWNLVK